MSHVFDYLDGIHERPSMYLANDSPPLRQIETYLWGYYAALSVHGIVESVPAMTRHFSTWIASETGWSMSRGWATGIADNVPPERALDVFFGYVDRYRMLEPVTVCRARLAPRHEPTGKRAVIGKAGRMKRPNRVEVVRYLPTRLHFLRFWYGKKAWNESILMDAKGSPHTSLAVAKRWVADELQTRAADWENILSSR